jgi:hypothetical protein
MTIHANMAFLDAIMTLIRRIIDTIELPENQHPLLAIHNKYIMSIRSPKLS